jgi:myo-inositol-1-phosphate synthase
LSALATAPALSSRESTFYDGSSVNSTGIGLMHRQIGSYRPGDIEIVAAFDIDRRKVGLGRQQAIFSASQLHEGLL